MILLHFFNKNNKKQSESFNFHMKQIYISPQIIGPTWLFMPCYQCYGCYGVLWNRLENLPHNKAGTFAWIYPESNRVNTIKAADLVKLILCLILWHICILEQNQLFGFGQCLSRVWMKVNSFYKLQPIL